MKIAIDIKSALGAKTGKGVYAYNVTKKLVGLSSEDEFILYAPRSEDLLIQELAAIKNVEIVQMYETGLMWHFKVFQDIISRYANGGLDAYFSPGSFIVTALMHFVSSFSFGIVKVPKFYVTVHDLVAFLYSDTHDKKAVWIEKITLKPTLKSAEKVFAVSDNTKKDVINKFGIAKEKIIVTYDAVGDHFLKFEKNEQDKSEFRKKYNLPSKYILSLGTLVPRKNIQLTLSAFELLCADESFPKDIDLCIVGGDGWGDSHELAMKQAEANPRIHMLGYLPYSELPLIYACADIFVYPSLYEGFGMPPLEAAFMDCPVIVSNASSLPEVVGDSAIKIDPYDVDALKDAISKLINDSALCDDLIKKGHENTKRFSWTRSAERILKTIKL